MENTKNCKHCGFSKEILLFDKCPVCRDGYNNICKECRIINNTKYRRSKKGVIQIMYICQIERSKKRNHPLPKYTFEEFKDWLDLQLNFDEIYFNWVNSNFETSLKPSIDRCNDYLGYSFDNITLGTWKENCDHNYKSQVNGENQKQCISVIQYTLKDKLIKEFFSIGEASRVTGIDTSSIIACCKERRKTAGNYIWKYKKY